MATWWERWMDRHRGRRGVLGWLVLQSDKRWLRRWQRALTHNKR